MAFSKDSFGFTLAGARCFFDSAQPAARPALEDALRALRDSLQDFASLPRAAVSELGSVHDMLLDSLAVIEAIAYSRFSSKARADFAEKCREHYEYVIFKCGEQAAAVPRDWGDGVAFATEDEAARTNILHVVGETLMHLQAHMAETLQSGLLGTAGQVGTADDQPVAFVPSIDDSSRQRRYLYVGKQTAIVEVHNGYSLHLDLRDVSQVPMLLRTGWWEPSIDQLLRSVLTPGMSYAIVGAKLGYHACLGAKLVERTGKAFMFEANPEAFALLRHTVAYNGFADRTFLREAAVVDEPGVRKFYFVREQLGVGTLYEPASFSASALSLDRNAFDYVPQDFTTLHAHATTLDQSVGSRIDKLDVLHLDTGDWEGPAILGGRELIARSPGLQIILKWSVSGETDEARREQHKLAVDFLVQHKFRFFRIAAPKDNAFKTPPDLVKVDPQDLLHLYRSDIFATRQ